MPLCFMVITLVFALHGRECTMSRLWLDKDGRICVYFLKRNCAPFLLPDFALMGLVAPFLQASVEPFLFTTVYSWNRACLKYGKEKVWHPLKAFSQLFWKFFVGVGVFESFRKTMPCNLVVQRPFTQPTHCSKAGVYSAGLDHQRST